MKIYSFPNALTFQSSLTVDEIVSLKKYNPTALNLVEPDAYGAQHVFFSLDHVETAYGSVNQNGITFVGQTEEGKALVSVLIPATLGKDEVKKYINDHYSTIVRYAEVVEKNAKEALVAVKEAEESFTDSIVELSFEEVE